MGKPQLGQIVMALRGRDSEKYAVIVDIIDDRFVRIADGNKRKFDQPKKKNIAHLELMPEISSEVVDSLRETGRVTNGKLRYAITKFVQRALTDADTKGD